MNDKNAVEVWISQHPTLTLYSLNAIGWMLIGICIAIDDPSNPSIPTLVAGLVLSFLLSMWTAILLK